MSFRVERTQSPGATRRTGAKSSPTGVIGDRYARMTGTIRKILREKGFGFIEPDDGSDDVFFSRGSMDPSTEFDDLREGEQVQFQVRPGDKGPRGVGVKLR
jgi:CspA family cold shock protein